MIIILESRNRVRYPMGVHIENNLPLINKVAKTLKEMYKELDVNIWCRGSSGAIMAAIIASKLKNTKIYHIKKASEDAHQSYYTVADGINIIVDDFISTGDTIEAILDGYIDMQHPNGVVKDIDCICLLGTIEGFEDRLTKIAKNVVCFLSA